MWLAATDCFRSCLGAGTTSMASTGGKVAEDPPAIRGSAIVEVKPIVSSEVVLALLAGVCATTVGLLNSDHLCTYIIDQLSGMLNAWCLTVGRFSDYSSLFTVIMLSLFLPLIIYVRRRAGLPAGMGDGCEANTVPHGELPQSQCCVELAARTDLHRAALAEMRSLVRASLSPSALESAAAPLDDDGWCCRFLSSADLKPSPAARQAAATICWRHSRQPIAPLNVAQADHIELLRGACATGTVFCPGRDRHGRGVIVVDNSAAPVGLFDGQVRLLAFTIEFALRQCIAPNNKLCYFFKLGSFSTQNQCEGR
jgi:hypothetical protein